MTDRITHSGRVVSLAPGKVTVEIIRTEACAGCHAASMCALSSQSVRTVAVEVRDEEDWSVGEQVKLSLVRRMGMKAVRICYIYPLLVLIVAMGVLYALTGSDVASGLGAIAAVGIYYMVVYFLRDRFRKEYVFCVEKCN